MPRASVNKDNSVLAQAVSPEAEPDTITELLAGHEEFTTQPTAHPTTSEPPSAL
ncbi:hypothetical protein ACWF9B_00525 [Streptomyces sp. NPDC055089]